MRPIVLVAAVALVDGEGRLLLAQRPDGRRMAGLWELPGGKVEPGESPEDALVRECREELAITIVADDLAPLSFASHPYEDFHLLMPLYLCRRWQGRARSMEGQEIRWVPPGELDTYPMPPADEPLIPVLRRALAA